MKTIFILSYCILLSSKISPGFIECYHADYPSYDAALVEYNKIMKSVYVINPDIQEVKIKDTVGVRQK